MPLSREACVRGRRQWDRAEAGQSRRVYSDAARRGDRIGLSLARPGVSGLPPEGDGAYNTSLAIRWRLYFVHGEQIVAVVVNVILARTGIV